MVWCLVWWTAVGESSLAKGTHPIYEQAPSRPHTWKRLWSPSVSSPTSITTCPTTGTDSSRAPAPPSVVSVAVVAAAAAGAPSPPATAAFSSVAVAVAGVQYAICGAYFWYILFRFGAAAVRLDQCHKPAAHRSDAHAFTILLTPPPQPNTRTHSFRSASMLSAATKS